MTANFSLPDDKIFDEPEIISLAIYSVFFLFGLTTNGLSLFQLVKERVKTKIRSKMNLLMIHLAVADILVDI